MGSASISSLSMRSLSFVVLLLTLVELAYGEDDSKFFRNDFPDDFVFGAGTSAYQVEGAVAEDGRSQSIWDTFTHQGKMEDKSTADTTANHYHKYKEDVKLMSDIGLEAYRFSISWARLVPNGRGAINPKGLQFYNNLINELIHHGIEPHVTLYHLDHPQVLEDEYGGWLSLKMVEDFTAFADICFREFGDRVSYWTTLNEANVFAIGAYDAGILPPNRCSYPFGLNCTKGNSTVEPYLVVHHSLLAHAEVFQLYRQKYLTKQNGWIGINVYAIWSVPLTNSTADIRASQRALDFYNGWILNPLVFGDYPETMKKNVGSRIPSFTKSQSKQLKGSFDFIGLNHYAAFYTQDASNDAKADLRDFNQDMFSKFSLGEDSPPGGVVPGKNLPTTPWALQDLLRYLKQTYGNPPIYIQENGYGMPKNETLNDPVRIDYIKGYINATLNAIREGSNTKGYIVWSFIDAFKLLTGYKSRYGLYHVDFESRNFSRTPKLSARWYSNFLNKKKIKEEKIETEKASSDAGSLALE